MMFVKAKTSLVLLFVSGMFLFGGCGQDNTNDLDASANIQEEFLFEEQMNYSVGDGVSLCAYVCTEKGMPYRFCLSCCKSYKCCRSKKIGFCDHLQPPLSKQTSHNEEASKTFKKSPSPCAEECWEYYKSCIGSDPTPMRKHICMQDYKFCLKTWPHCVPPVH